MIWAGKLTGKVRGVLVRGLPENRKYPNRHPISKLWQPGLDTRKTNKQARNRLGLHFEVRIWSSAFGADCWIVNFDPVQDKFCDYQRYLILLYRHVKWEGKRSLSRVNVFFRFPLAKYHFATRCWIILQASSLLISLTYVRFSFIKYKI